VGAEIERGISGSYQGEEIDANLFRLQAYKCLPYGTIFCCLIFLVFINIRNKFM